MVALVLEIMKEECYGRMFQQEYIVSYDSVVVHVHTEQAIYSPPTMNHTCFYFERTNMQEGDSHGKCSAHSGSVILQVTPTDPIY